MTVENALKTPLDQYGYSSKLRFDGRARDETTIPILAPGTKKTRKDYLWAVMRDQRGWGGADPPIVVFHHSQSRSARTAQEVFKGYKPGTLTVDGYAAYDVLADPKKTNAPWQLSFCWTHGRRKFVEFSRTTPSPICDDMLRHLAALYKVKAEIRGKTPPPAWPPAKSSRSPSLTLCAPGWRPA